MAGDVDALFTWNRSESGDRLKGPRIMIAGPFLKYLALMNVTNARKYGTKSRAGYIPRLG